MTAITEQSGSDTYSKFSVSSEALNKVDISIQITNPTMNNLQNDNDWKEMKKNDLHILHKFSVPQQCQLSLDISLFEQNFH